MPQPTPSDSFRVATIKIQFLQVKIVSQGISSKKEKKKKICKHNSVAKEQKDMQRKMVSERQLIAGGESRKINPIVCL